MRKTKHKIPGIILAVMLCLSMLPVPALAASVPVSEQTAATEQAPAPVLTAEISGTVTTEEGGKTVPLSEKTVVIDTVGYENLTPGTEYALTGSLLDKESGLPVTGNGSPITVEAVFTPTASSGAIELSFVFDSRAIGGRTLTVLETLKCGGAEVAANTDIPEDEPCVTVEAIEPPEPAKPVPQTGDNGESPDETAPPCPATDWDALRDANPEVTV